MRNHFSIRKGHIDDLRYTVTVTDAMGCVGKGTPFYSIYLKTASISEVISAKQVILYPNPVEYMLNLPSGTRRFQIFKEVVHLFPEE